MIDYKIEDYELVAYYSYTTTVMDRICSYRMEFGNDGSVEERLAKKVQTFFKKLCDAANAIEHHSWYDNKCCFKVRHKRSGNTMFVGQYDWAYTIGLSCRQVFGRVYEFDKCRWTEIRDTDYSRELEY